MKTDSDFTTVFQRILEPFVTTPRLPRKMPAKSSTQPATESNTDGLGQIFTPPAIVDCMLKLVRNNGRVLEPACGDGAFLKHFPQAMGIEIDPRRHQRGLW